MAGATIEDMTSKGHIGLMDGPVVHDYLIFQGENGSWWGYRDQVFLLAETREELLIQIAEAIGIAPDLDDLNARFERATVRVAERREEDRRRDILAGNRKPGTGRCPKCGGTGEVHKGVGTVTCPTCNGAGVVSTG